MQIKRVKADDLKALKDMTPEEVQEYLKDRPNYSEPPPGVSRAEQRRRDYMARVERRKREGKNV